MMNYYRANYPRGTGSDVQAPPTVQTNNRGRVPVLVLHGMKDTALNAAGPGAAPTPTEPSAQGASGPLRAGIFRPHPPPYHPKGHLLA